jgi:8-oxo-dGTP diphosphatase
VTGASSFDQAEVRAAGGVVWRADDEGAPRFAVIHRPRYDDWSLPKGKLDPGESWEDAALREVEEGIGAVCELEQELPPIAYRDDKNRDKVVRYWLMEPVEVPDFEPNDEVDRLEWCSASVARELLTYERDVEVLESALEVLGS